MTNWKLRMTSLTLAAALFCAAPAPALAAAAETGKSGWMETLLEVPVLGDLVRIITGSGKEASTAETAATAETATTETATAETANALQTTPETAWKPVSQGWMQGAVQAGVAYPQGSADITADTCVVNVQQWGSVELMAGVTLNPAAREETNLGDLAADAAAAAAASWLWSGEETASLRGLPVVALIDGASLTGNVAAGATLADVAKAVAADTALSMVQVTPKKLYEMLNQGLAGMNDSSSDSYGGFWQVSGLRALYQTTENEPRFVEAFLISPDTETGIRLDGGDEQNTLLVVLPTDMLSRCGVNAEAGYTDYLAGASLTLDGAVAALPQNVNAETLTVLLSRGGSTGRVLPVTAATYDGVVNLGTAYAGRQISFLLDGAARTATADDQGRLVITGLSAGSHTFCLAAGEPAYYLSNLTFIGTADAGATAVTVANVPEACVAPAAATPTPAPAATPAATATPAPTATPTPTATPQVVTVTSPEEDTSPAATPSPTPVPAAPTATQKPARTTPAPVQDPTAGLLDTTPAPTVAPTATPSPTPKPTPDPETLEQQEEMRQTSSMLPFYIGIGVVLVGGVTAAVLVLRSRIENGNNRTYRRRKK